MRYFCCLLLILGFVHAQAQQVLVSEPQKLSSKTPNSSILGKNNEGIIIYKFGKGTDVIEAYSGNMALRWKKVLNIKQENSSILKMILLPEKTYAFFLSQDKNASVVYAQKLNSKFIGDGSFVVMDTIVGNRNDVSEQLTIVHSQNRSQFAVYFPVKSSGKLASIQVAGIDGSMALRYQTSIAVPTEVAYYTLDGVVPDNDGNLVLLFESNERGSRRKTEPEFKTYFFRAADRSLLEVPFSLDQPIFGNVALEVDNVNGHIAMGGFYSDDDRKNAKGYFYEVYDQKTGQLGTHTYTDFPMAMLTQITGKDSSHTERGLYSFKIKDLVLRHDGGALVIAESQYSNTENIETPSFGPTAMGPSTRTVKMFYYNDIMALSLKSDGSIDWYNILHKKQVSEEDDGFYSSFCTVTTNKKLHFIYNDEIYYKTNVYEYAIDPLGQDERQLLLNSGERDILLAPSIAKQISANEVLIPSFRKNTVRFVKITY